MNRFQKQGIATARKYHKMLKEIVEEKLHMMK